MLKPQFNINRDNFYGNGNAQLELVEYGDYLCTHCGNVYVVVQQLLEFFGTEIRFVFRNFPLPNLHPLALDAAVAAEAAGLQGRFWDMHKAIFENQKYLNRASLCWMADELGLDLIRFEKERQDKKLFEKVIGDFESGIKSGVNSTPTFFINGLRYNGFDNFHDIYEVCNHTNKTNDKAQSFKL